MVDVYGLFLIHQVNLLHYTDKSVMSFNPYTTTYMYTKAYTYIILEFHSYSVNSNYEVLLLK